MKNLRIAIDGPSGAGKSTVARLVACLLGIVYMDTGAVFRTIALYLISKKFNFSCGEEGLDKLLPYMDIDIRYIEGSQYMFLDDKDVTGEIRTNEISSLASEISQYPPVREKVLELERKVALNENVVMDGRDIGTVVLPEATVKIFLTADTKERALRRYKELDKSGKLNGMSLKEVENEVIKRDLRDITRENAPLKIAPDAQIIDSTKLTALDVANKIVALVKEKL